MTAKFFISFNPVPIQFPTIYEKEGRRIKAGAVFSLDVPEGSRDDRLAKKYVKMNTIIPISEEDYKKYSLMRRGEIVEKEEEIRAKLGGKKAIPIPKSKAESESIKEIPKGKTKEDKK